MHSCEHQLVLKQRAARVEAKKSHEGPKRDCTCKRARHSHGTAIAYKVDKCRCRECIDANTAEHRTYNKAVAFGRYDSGRVDAGPAREHVRTLMAAGISWKQVARKAGLSYSTVCALLYGRYERGHAPYGRVARGTAEKILAIRPSLENMAPGALTDATGTRRRLQALVTIGWSQSLLASFLGIQRGNFTLIANDQVTAGKALQVKELYERLWNTPPAENDRWARQSAARTRSYAKNHGWVPPMAWDDDEIDIPEVKPETRRGKRGLSAIEDVEFLIKTGETPDEIGRRTNGNWKSVERLLYRHGRQDLIAAAKSELRENARQARRKAS
jgi:transcriptional regulator with XRE-family HTH domain